MLLPLHFVPHFFIKTWMKQMKSWLHISISIIASFSRLIPFPCRSVYQCQMLLSQCICAMLDHSIFVVCGCIIAEAFKSNEYQRLENLSFNYWPYMKFKYGDFCYVISTNVSLSVSWPAHIAWYTKDVGQNIFLLIWKLSTTWVLINKSWRLIIHAW